MNLQKAGSFHKASILNRPWEVPLPGRKLLPSTGLNPGLTTYPKAKYSLQIVKKGMAPYQPAISGAVVL